MKKLFLSFSVVVIFLVLSISVQGCKKKSHDACTNVACLNGGTCSNGVCQCDSLHEGTHCETEKRTKYIGSFVGAVNCTSITHLDLLRFTDIPDSANQVNIFNLHSEASNTLGIILANGSVSIPAQSLNGNTVSGAASVINGKIVVNFNVITAIDSVTNDTDVCSWTQKW